MKKVLFHPKAREAIRLLPDKVRAGFVPTPRGSKALYAALPTHKECCAGVEELRVKGPDGIYRAFYFTRSSEGILVVHVFVKKTQKTFPLDIELGRKRLREMLNG